MTWQSCSANTVGGSLSSDLMSAWLPYRGRIAIEQSERFSISYWDAAILAAAEALGADTVYSEDLSHGQRYGRVRVVNPFA